MNTPASEIPVSCIIPVRLRVPKSCAHVLSLLILAWLCGTGASTAQNFMRVEAVSGRPGDTLTMGLDIVNQDSIVGFQVSITLPTGVEFLPSTVSLTSRSRGHSLSAAQHSGGILRILCYQFNQLSLYGDSGDVVTWRVRLLPDPGTHTISLSNATLSDSTGTNILTSSSNGQVTILAPRLSVNTDSLSMGRRVLFTSSDTSFIVSNSGTDTLTITRISCKGPGFIILGDTTFSLGPADWRSVSIRFHPLSKGFFGDTILFASDDPRVPLFRTPVHAISFAVNELRMDSPTGRAQQTAVAVFSVDNMEPFTAFQFDVVVPAGLRWIPDSALLLAAGSGHVFRADFVAINRVRILCHSVSRGVFPDSVGALVSMTFQLDGPGGMYPIGLEHVVLADTLAENTVSAVHSGSISIAAADIQLDPLHDLGDVSTLDTVLVLHAIANQGNDTLAIESLRMSNGYFAALSPMPLVIPPGMHDTLRFRFHAQQRRLYSDTCFLRCNDPDERFVSISLSARAYTPDTLGISSVQGYRGTSVTCALTLKNSERITAFQVDVVLPPQLRYDSGSVQSASGRTTSHTVSAAVHEAHVLRIVGYSTNRDVYTNDTGTIATFSLTLLGPDGSYPLALINAVLSDTNGQNVCSGIHDGTITIATIRGRFRVMLQGPASPAADSMGTTMNVLGLLPDEHPYHVSPWNYPGMERVDSSFFPLHRDVVDWILVELRTATAANTTVARRAAFLLRNGDIVDVDGLSPVGFSGIGPADVHVVLRHRNHLAVMSDSTVHISDTVSATVYTHDFTLSDTQAFGTHALIQLAAGIYGCISGDANSDGEVNALDRNETWNGRNGTGYLSGDVTLDGELNALDRNSTWNNRNLVTQVP